VTLDSLTVHDAGLHAAWQAGDPHAAADLVLRYRPKLRSLGERLGLTRPDAEDLAQQVLLEAPRSQFVARAGATYWSWLSTIAQRRAMQMRRRTDAFIAPRRLTTPWAGTCRRRLLECIEEMPEPTRDVFVRLVAGYDAADIAAELGLEPATVRQRIHRGRQWLRRRGH
jgi:RNA polymerase sigma factor (sigma-70 family)